MAAIRVRAYFSPDEHRQLTNLAQEAGLPLSAFIRKASLNQKVSSTVDKEAILSLLQSKADLGRLGGLLKQYLGESAESSLISRQEARDLLHRINKTQSQMTEQFSIVTDSLLPRSTKQ